MMKELIAPYRIREYKTLKWFVTPTGNRIIVLPKCSVELSHLMQENWNNAKNLSPSDSERVTQVTELANGEKTSLFVKSPVRVFSGDEKRVRKGKLVRKHGPQIKLPKKYHALVEEQANWEARILLGLRNIGERAEEPQAIVINANGSKQLITKDAGKQKQTGFFSYKLQGLLLRLKEARLRLLGINARDLRMQNAVDDEKGNKVLIDVARWTWSPFTDAYHNKLMNAILSEIEKQKKA